jgi:hypothetical protein
MDIKAYDVCKIVMNAFGKYNVPSWGNVSLPSIRADESHTRCSEFTFYSTKCSSIFAR